MKVSRVQSLQSLLPAGLHEKQILCLMKHGSHLYGTSGPDSDTDWKGVYMPSERQLFTGKIPKSYSMKPKKTGEGVKNSRDDIDIEIYSLHYFLELASKGETVAIDMLHAPPVWPLVTSSVWCELHNNRQMFHTKNLKAFVGYARKQAAKYGIKGGRLNAAKEVIDYFDSCLNEFSLYSGLPMIRLYNVWNNLPEGEHIHKIPTDWPNQPDIYQVCGKQLQSTAKVSYCRDILAKFYEEYGERAKLAARNEGIDWKAVSHALRAAYQVESILTEGDITFPLKPASYLKSVKSGNVPWNQVQEDLETMMARIEKLSEQSDLPESVDRIYWTDWLFRRVKDSICVGCQHEIPF